MPAGSNVPSVSKVMIVEVERSVLVVTMLKFKVFNWLMLDMDSVRAVRIMMVEGWVLAMFKFKVFDWLMPDVDSVKAMRTTMVERWVLTMLQFKILDWLMLDENSVRTMRIMVEGMVLAML